MFTHNNVNQEILKQRAYNLRWATVAEGVIPLTAADPDFPCAPEISDSIIEFSKSRYMCYGPPEGLPNFKESMAGFYKNTRNVPALPEFTLPVDSAAFGIYITCKAFLKAGDAAIIFDPVDFLFRYSVEAVGANAIPFKIPPGQAPVDFEALENLITPAVKLLCLCNPLNPTGKVFTKKELEKLGQIAKKHNLLILSDEIWSDIIFKGHSYTSIASLDEELRQRVIIVTGFSKSYGLAGLRIGAVMAFNKSIYQLLLDASLHNSTIHGANVLSQIAAATALNKCGYWLEGFIKHLNEMRDICVNGLNSVEGFNCIAPEGCYVAFVDITETGKTSKQIQEILLEKAKVSVVPGLKEWFGEGAEGYIRLSFATSEDILKEALFRIKNTIHTI
jgi:aminotransferase